MLILLCFLQYCIFYLSVTYANFSSISKLVNNRVTYPNFIAPMYLTNAYIIGLIISTTYNIFYQMFVLEEDPI